MKNKNLLEVHAAKIQYGGIQIFEKLDFSWEKDQHWAVIGNSGNLLTVFLESLRGNSVVTAGEISRPFAVEYLKEKNSEGEVHSFRDLMAYVSQKYGLKNRSNQQNFYFQQRFNSSESEEACTVREYLCQVVQKNEGPWSLEKTTELLNLSQHLNQSLLKLSNGETRRLVLALGLMRQPMIYLMDQPMTGLDAKTRAEFGTILQEMIQTGVHVLITTSPEEIPEGITHVAKLDSSGIINLWTRKDFFNFEHQNSTLKWDWKLLDSLLPQNQAKIECLVQLEDVTISYGGKKILDRLTWTIQAGDRWLLKGPNGSGKSTLISLLIGENPQAYAQNIHLFGKKRGSGESIWDIKKPVGFMAPELSRYFPPNQTCLKVILSGLFDTMGLFKKPTTEQELTAESWLRLFDLEAVKDVTIQRLSLAQQRWTLLARALIKQPKLLILDEASQGMDDLQRALFKDTIQKVCERYPVALIYVSHYPEDIPTVVNLTKDLS